MSSTTPTTSAEAIAACRAQGLAEPEKVARASWPELFVVDDGGPAFPCQVQTGFTTSICGPFDGSAYAVPQTAQAVGMSLRDWFAGQFVAGVTSTSEYFEGQWAIEGIAQQAFELADAMIAARKTGGAS